MMKKIVLAAVVVFLFLFQTPPALGVTCTADTDLICPDSSCIGTDPDCCNGGNPCPTGLYCNIPTTTCLLRNGQACTSSADCGTSDNYCSPDAGLCVSKNFVFIKPTTVRTSIGTKPVLAVTVFDPANRTGTYKANVVSTGSYFSRFFGTENAVTFSMKPGEVKVIPVYFSAGAIGSYQLQVRVVDSKYGSVTLFGGYPRGIVGWSEIASIEVVTETRTPTFVSAPGPSLPVLVGVLGILAFAFLLV